MCDIAMALTAVATVAAGAGAIYQGVTASQAADYNRQVAQMNAAISEKRAVDALERGREDEQRKRFQVAQLQGEQIAAMAANGVDLAFGSPLDTLVDTAFLGELDALTIRRNAANESYDYRVQAASGRADADQYARRAQSSLVGGYLDGVGTILGGGSKLYKDYRTASYVPAYN